MIRLNFRTITCADCGAATKAKTKLRKFCDDCAYQRVRKAQNQATKIKRDLVKSGGRAGA